MKKKILIISLSLIMILSLTGCHREKENEPENNKTLSDWINSGKGVVCTVNTPQGKITTKVKGNKVRMDGIIYVDMTSFDAKQGVQKGSSITDGEWYYMWGENNGIKMNIKKMEQIGKEAESDYGVEEDDYSVSEWAKKMEDAKASYNCREENISDNEFEVPNNIKFVDLMEMFENMQNLGQDIMSDDSKAIENLDLPKVKGSNEMTQEEIEAQLEKLMQK